ncbi:MAG: PP2C family protein-serine/threonine phosphatase [Acidobacteriota bacterium]
MAENLGGLRAEVGAFSLGAILLALGFATGALATVRRHDRGARLLAIFAPFSLLYGLRMLASIELVHRAFPAPRFWAYVIVDCTYILPAILLAFIEELHGPGWAQSLRGARWLWIVYAFAGVSIDAVRGPGTAMGPNSALVVLALVIILFNQFRPGQAATLELRVVRWSGALVSLVVLVANLADLGLVPWKPPEAVAFALFVATLCYLAAHRFFAGQRRLLAIGAELEMARKIQSGLLPKGLPALAETTPEGRHPRLAIATRYVPMAEVGGDIYDWVALGPERLGLLVADVSGHGVPAALLASMVKMALLVLGAEAKSAESTMAALNAALCGNVERGFVTAGYLILDLDGTNWRVSSASGGHPPALLWRTATRELVELVASGPVLGRFRGAKFVGGVRDLAPGDRLLLFTDGLIEATNGSGELFGEGRLRAAWQRAADLPIETFADAIWAELSDWVGRGTGCAQFDDDVTLLVVDILKE